MLSATTAFGSQLGRPERLTIIWSSLGLAMLLVMGAIASWTLRQVEVSDHWVNHTYQVINASQDLFGGLRDAEIDVQRYRLTGEQASLNAYRTAVSAIPSRFVTVQDLTADNPNQQRRLGQLGTLIAAELKRLDLVARQEKPTLPDSSKTATERSIRRLDQDLEAEEYRLLEQRYALRRARMWHGAIASMLSATVTLIAFIVAPVQVRRAAKQRNVAQRENQESASIIRSLFQAAPLAIMIVDAQNTITMANAEADRMFGFSTGGLCGQTLDSLLREPFRAAVLRKPPQSAETVNDINAGPLDGKGQRRDGSFFDAEICLGSIETAAGQLVVVFVSDITRRRANERAIEEHRERLSHLAGRLMTVQDDERRWIARNLHDDLTQTLAYIAMDLGRLAAGDSTGDTTRNLQALQKRAADATEYVRRISHQLHPSILDDLGLKTALEEFCIEFQERYGITTHFTSHNVPDELPCEVANCVYQIAGECLRNVFKHSQSRTAFLEIGACDESLLLTVRDEGIGFTSARGSSTGIGLAAMKERAHLVAGTLFIDSTPGEGTVVKLGVPLDRTGVTNKNA